MWEEARESKHAVAPQISKEHTARTRNVDAEGHLLRRLRGRTRAGGQAGPLSLLIYLSMLRLKVQITLTESWSIPRAALSTGMKWYRVTSTSPQPEKPKDENGKPS